MSDVKGHNLQLLYTLCQLVVQVLPGQISRFHQGVQFLLQWAQSLVSKLSLFEQYSKTANNMQFFKNYFFTIGFISISEWMTRFTTSFALQISFWRALYVDTAVMTCCRVVTDELVTLSSDRASSIASSKPLARPVGNCNLKNQIKFVSRLMSTRNKHLRQYI